MKRILLTSALALTLAAPALASDQLARSLGVEPGVYSTAQLVALRSALENDEIAFANAIRNSGGAGESVSASSKNAGNSQFVASAGVGSDFTAAEVAALRAAEDSDNHAQAYHIRKTGGSTGAFTASTKGGVSAGHAQLAASLGVDPADYSLAELAHLKAVQSSENGRGE